MSNFTLIKSGIKNLIPIVFVFFINNNVFSQDHLHSDHDDCTKSFSVDRTNYVIKFGSSNNFQVANPFNVPISWNIVGSPQFQKSGHGNETGDIFFDTPGNYKVVFTSSAMGKYSSLSETINVDVVATNFTFVMDKAKLSNDVKQGQSVDGITLTVPVVIASYNGEDIKFGPFKNSTTGIDGIDFILDEQIVLKPGINNVTFKLQGNAQNFGPAQIGLFDPNGEGYFYNFLISK